MMRARLFALVAGMLFGLGLLVGGMTDPNKVIGFLDFFGHWDPSLAFVMAGAIAVHACAYAFKRRQLLPWFGVTWHLSTRKDIDARLLGGAAIFGVGWGLAGYCPGPALVSLATGSLNILLFVLCMVLGGWLVGRVELLRAKHASVHQ